MVVLEAMLQIGRDTVPFLLGLWRWWVVPGLVALLIVAYFMLVSRWRSRGIRILAYVVGVFLTILAVYWEAARIIVFEYGSLGYTPDLPITIYMAIVQMMVGAFAIFIIARLFRRQGR